MKPILCFQNVSLEGPAGIGEFLAERNIPLEIRDLFKGMDIPSDPESFGAVVVLGGPMNIYQEAEFPFLKKEKRFLESCVHKGTPILGICLGAQLLADVLGAKVRKNEESEIGWMKVDLTEEGKQSDLFAGISSSMDVFQWHGDTFEIPAEAVHLASSPKCRNQAFVYRERWIGLQFHPEINMEEATRWAKAYLQDTPRENREIVERLIHEPDWEKGAQTGRSEERFLRNCFQTLFGSPENPEGKKNETI